MLVLLSLAHAATLAILPLDPGGETEAHPGLGLALSSMMTTDMAGLDGLTLVERDRLDAVLAEVELGASGYVDPATAQVAGLGLGAEHVLVGTWTVIDTSLRIDARILSVQSGEVVGAASAAGATADFVALEKDIVADLLGDLSIEVGAAATRRIMVQTPTEVFDALAAYGAGLQAQANGDVEQARTQFSRAVSSDPAFAEARDSLSQLSAALETASRTRVASQQSVQEVLYDQVMAATEGVSTTHPSDDDMAKLALRWFVHHKRGEYCARYESMRAVAESVGWDVTTLPSTVNSAALLAFELGLESPRREGQTHAESPGLSTATTVTSDADRFFIGYDRSDPGYEQSQSMTSSMMRCLPKESWVSTLLDWETKVVGTGVAEERTDRQYSGITAPLRMTMMRAYLVARLGQMTEAMAAELLAMAETSGLSDDDRQWISHHTERVVEAGEQGAELLIYGQGMDPQVSIGIGRAIATEDRTRVSADGECASSMRVATRILGDLFQDLDEPQTPLDRLRTQANIHRLVTVPLDLGCVQGVPARFPTTASIVAHIDTVRPQLIAEVGDVNCRGKLADLDQQIAGLVEGYEEMARPGLIYTYTHSLYMEGCFGFVAH
jgi:TolB-like protein